MVVIVTDASLGYVVDEIEVVEGRNSPLISSNKNEDGHISC